MTQKKHIHSPSWWQLLTDMGQPRLDMLSAWLNRYGPIIRLPLKKPTYLLYDPDWIQAILIQHPNQFTRSGDPFIGMRDLLGQGLITGDEATWKSQRQALAPWFHPRMMDTYLPLIDRCIDQALERWRTQHAATEQPFDIANEMMLMVLDIIATVLLGDHLRPFLQEVIDLVLTCNRYAGQLSFYPDRYLNWRYLRFRWARQRLHVILRHIMDTADQPATWFNDCRQACDPSSSLSEPQLLDQIKTLLIAGHETTGNLLSFFWYMMGQHPEVLSHLSKVAQTLPQTMLTLTQLQQAHPIQQALQETMRLYPPVWMIARTSNTEHTIDGQVLPPGANFFMYLYHLHRSEFWPQANRFNPDRFATDPPTRGLYAPFGLGPKLCIAKHLATLQSTYIITRVLQRFTLDLTTQPIQIEALISLRPQHGIGAKIQLRR